MKVKNLALMAMMAAVLCVIGPLTIQVGMIPFSLVPLGIWITVMVLGWKKGTISCLVYIVLGLAGMPVFSGYSGGFGKLIGPTGGFIVGYLVMALVSGFIIEYGKGRILAVVGGMLIGLLLLYSFGVCWLSVWGGQSLVKSIGTAALPFIVPDLIKVAIATGFYLIGKKQLFQYTR